MALLSHLFEEVVKEKNAGRAWGWVTKWPESQDRAAGLWGAQQGRDPPPPRTTPPPPLHAAQQTLSALAGGWPGSTAGLPRPAFSAAPPTSLLRGQPPAPVAKPKPDVDSLAFGLGAPCTHAAA